MQVSPAGSAIGTASSVVGQSTLGPYLHTFTACKFWDKHRAMAAQSTTTTCEHKSDFTLEILRAHPKDSVYQVAANWAAALDKEEGLFWQAEI